MSRDAEVDDKTTRLLDDHDESSGPIEKISSVIENYDGDDHPPISIGLAFSEIMKMLVSTIPFQFIKSAVPFANAILLARYSPVVRDTAVPVQTLIDFTTNVLNSPMNLLNTLVGNVNVAAKRKEVGKVAQAGMTLAVMVSIPQIAILLCSGPLLSAIGESSEVSGNATEFFNNYVISVPFLSAVIACNQIAMGMKYPSFPLVTQFLGAIFYGSLIYPMMFGSSVIPEQGIAGSGRTFIVDYVSVLLFSFLGFFILNRSKESFKAYNLFKPSFVSAKELFSAVAGQAKIAWQILLITLSELGVLTLTNLLVVSKNPDDSTAQLVISQFQDVVLLFSSSTASVAQSLISNYNGENKKKSIPVLGNVGIAFSLLFPVAYFSLGMAIPDQLMSLYLNVSSPANNRTVELLKGGGLLSISSANSALMAVRFVTTYSLFGMGEFDRNLVGAMLLTWIGVGVSIGVVYGTDFDSVVGLNLGLTLGFFVSALAQSINWGVKSRRLSASKSRGFSLAVTEHQQEDRPAVILDVE